LKIGQEAFFHCPVDSIRLPAELISIGDSAFASCDNLTAIQVDGANRVFADQDGVLFNKALTELIVYPRASSLTTITLPNGLISIGNRAFDDCSGLNSITVLATQPPLLNGSLWRWGEPPALIYVPSASLNLYKNAEGWKEDYADRIQAVAG
jgi:hypothetical protein